VTAARLVRPVCSEPWHYRNTDNSHGFKRETNVEAKPVTGTDRKVGEATGTRETRIRADDVRA